MHSERAEPADSTQRETFAHSLKSPIKVVESRRFITIVTYWVLMIKIKSFKIISLFGICLKNAI
jgi:hypothetical protein